MDTSTSVRENEALIVYEVQPEGRSERLRRQYWDKAYLQTLRFGPVAGCGEDTLTGHAQDFAALLAASDPIIQPDELIVGCGLVVPEDRDSIDLGH